MSQEAAWWCANPMLTGLATHHVVQPTHSVVRHGCAVVKKATLRSCLLMAHLSSAHSSPWWWCPQWRTKEEMWKPVGQYTQPSPPLTQQDGEGPGFYSHLGQQKAKETPKKAKQPTETLNLSLWWRCRHVKYNLSWQEPVSAFWLCSRYQETTKVFKLCGLKCIVTLEKSINKEKSKNHGAVGDRRQSHLHRKNHQCWEF